MQEYITYLRVSTQEQKHSGLGIEAQRQLVEDHIKQYEGKLIDEFVEYESGKKTSNEDRPQLHMAIHFLREHPKAKLLIARTDRIARDLHFISGLLKQKVPLIVAGHENMTKLEWHMHAMIAEHEADLISTRTKQALKAAKDRGVKLGPPKEKLAKAQRKGAHAYQKATQEFRTSIRPMMESLLNDKSLQKASGKIDRYLMCGRLNGMGIKTMRKTKWSYQGLTDYLTMENLI